MELEDPQHQFTPIQDGRRRLPEPPVVRVVAIEEVRLPAAAGLEKELDAFYVGLLKFERMNEPTEAGLMVCYKSATMPVLFEIVEGPAEREDFRPLQVEIPHIKDFIVALNDAQTPYEWQRGLTPGTDLILLRDPAGNWVSVGAWTAVR